MSRQYEEVERPGGITFLVVLGWIQGLLALGGGIFLILDRNSEELQSKADMSADQLVSTGVGAIVFGTAVLILASMLGRGNSVVRWLFGLLVVVNVGIAIWGLFGLHGEQQLSAAVSLVFGLLILYLLFGPDRTDRWFDQN
jgi:cytochrome bd-type quinol oxidase subunit 2